MSGQGVIWEEVAGNHLIDPRLTAEDCGNRVFDELTSAARLTIGQLADRTNLKRSQASRGIHWLRRTLGDEALVCNKDHTYELAMQSATVSDYRRRRLQFIANSLKTLRNVLKAGVAKFGGDDDTRTAVELLGAAVSLLERGAQVRPEPRKEEGLAELVS